MTEVVDKFNQEDIIKQVDLLLQQSRTYQDPTAKISSAQRDHYSSSDTVLQINQMTISQH